MKLLVDADACPNVIKEILFRAAVRKKIHTLFVANTWLNLPKSAYIKMKKVKSGFDVADDEIIAQAEPGDLVITADIPLAYLAVKKGCLALNPRGKIYTEDTIQDALASRDLMSHLRESGAITGGSGGINKSDRQAFANHLDRIITKNAV
jgi:uncharacterized protein